MIPKPYDDQLLAIREMLDDLTEGSAQMGYDLLFKLWLSNHENEEFKQEILRVAVDHSQLTNEFTNRLRKLHLSSSITNTYLRKGLEALASDIENYKLKFPKETKHLISDEAKPERIKTNIQTSGIPPININISENQRTKFTWWQLVFIAVYIISLGLILVLPQPFQKVLVIAATVCSAVFLFYIVPKRDHILRTDLSNIKLSYTSPNYLSLGDENTIYIAIENPSQTEFSGKITLVFNDPDSLVTPAPDQSLSAKVEVSPLGREAKQFRFVLLKRPSDGNLNYYFQISSDKSQYKSNEESFSIAPIPYLRSTWAWLFGSAGLGALILALLWELLEKGLGIKP